MVLWIPLYGGVLAVSYLFPICWTLRLVLDFHCCVLLNVHLGLCVFLGHFFPNCIPSFPISALWDQLSAVGTFWLSYLASTI